MFFASMYQPPKDDPMPAWLLEHEKEIDDGSATFQGDRITRNTVLTSYQLVGSVILVTMRTSTPLLVKDSEAGQAAFIRCTAVTAFFGWWSLFGLFHTPNALFTNFSGGTQKTVGELLNEMHNPVEIKKPHPLMQYVPLLIFPLGILVAFGLIVAYAIFK